LPIASQNHGAEWSHDSAKQPAAVRQQVAIVAHRGAAALAPENTMAAFRKAHQVGADMFELDVHLSADGVPVVIHDDTLERTTDIEKYYGEWGLKKDVQVSSLPLEKLKRLDAGTWFVERDRFGTIRSGAVTREEADSYRGEPIPTLDEALRFADENNIGINVEIKQIPRFYDGIAARCVAAIDRMRDKSLVLVSSFDHEICREVKALDPELAVAPLCGERIADPGRYVAEVVGGEVFHPAKSALGCSEGRPVEDVPVNVVDILSAHRRGVTVNVWTVNDRPTMRRLVRAGVDGIITDYPHVLREVLEEDGAP
jgi:glycerophosphoryl diester phosphodiesterase